MFRFSIRDVLWLTVVVALAVGWWTERRRAETEHLRAEDAAALAAKSAKLEFINTAVTAAWKRTLADAPMNAPLPRD